MVHVEENVRKKISLDTVMIMKWYQREIKVYNPLNVIDVQTSGSHVSSKHNFTGTILEPFHTEMQTGDSGFWLVNGQLKTLQFFEPPFYATFWFQKSFMGLSIVSWDKSWNLS